MASETMKEPGVLEIDDVRVRTLGEDDLEAVVAIDAVASGRSRPRYFELMMRRSLGDGAVQVSLIAELEGEVVGFVIASLYYGEYGVAEPTASVDAIGIAPERRRRHIGQALIRQLRLNLDALKIERLRTEVR